MSDQEYDVVVIGAGPTGENVADRARRGGLSVAVAESELVGGECSYWACVPSKALLRPAAALAAARAVDGARQAVTGELDAAAVLARRTRFTHGWSDDSGQVKWLDGTGSTLVRGAARLAGERKVEVTAPDGGPDGWHGHAGRPARGGRRDRQRGRHPAGPRAGRTAGVDEPRGDQRRDRARPPRDPRRRRGGLRDGHRLAGARRRGHHAGPGPAAAGRDGAVRRRPGGRGAAVGRRGRQDRHRRGPGPPPVPRHPGGDLDQRHADRRHQDQRHYRARRPGRRRVAGRGRPGPAHQRTWAWSPSA